MYNDCAYNDCSSPITNASLSLLNSPSLIPLLNTPFINPFPPQNNSYKLPGEASRER